MLLKALLCCLLCLCQCMSAVVRDDCDVKMTVSSLSHGCEMVYSAISEVNYQCNSFEMALLLSSQNVTSINCTEITLPSGNHTVSSSFSFDQNIVLVGQTNGSVVKVTFPIDIAIQSSLGLFEPLYVLEFRSADYIGIFGIEFEGSPGIIGIKNLTKVEIENCSFRYFTEGAVDIFDSFLIFIHNCIFENNGPVTNVLKKQPYSIHSGGMSIVMDHLPEREDNIEPIILITSCQFINNSAVPTAEHIRSTNDIFTRNIFTGRGGGLGITLHSPEITINGYVKDSLFERNTAGIWGGGMYVIFGLGSNHTIVTKSNKYIDNLSFSGAGGLFVGSLETGTREIFSSMFVEHCEFIGNSAEKGGATVWPVPGTPGSPMNDIANFARYENCTFIGNRANYNSAVSLVTVDTLNTQLSHRPVEMVNCTFIDNVAINSPALFSTFVPIQFEGRIIFDGNKGGAIEIVGAIAGVKGYVLISNTQTVGTNRAAFQISSFGQIMLYKGADIVFHNNTGSLGAALISQTQSLSVSFIQLIYNPLCFLLYENFRATPNEWTDVRMSFSNNKAIVGAATYTDILDTCSWSQLKHPFFDNDQVLRWNFIEFGENTNTFHSSDATNPQWYVQTSAVEINSVDSTIYTYPGEEFRLNLSVLDELKQPVAAPVRILGLQTSSDNIYTAISLQPEVNFFINRSSTLAKKALLSKGENIYGTYKLLLSNIFNLERGKASSLYIQLRNCPPGFVLTDAEEGVDLEECLCNFDNINIVTCLDRKPMFERAYWATTDSREVNSLGLYSCPNGYCRCFAMETSETECLYTYDSGNPDVQCNCKRKGVLCGECRNDTGVSALLNRCTTCYDAFSILIITLVIVDCIVMIIIVRFFLSVTYPALLLPCIFYIQFLPYGTEVFQKDFQYIRPYLYYVSSALSFYFPYDFCLFSNMSSLTSYYLRFIPLILALTITPIMLLISWKFVERFVNKKWNLVCLLILLLYPHSLHTALSILNCPLVHLNGTTDSRWYIDGSVQCFRGGHIPLGLLAILVLFICVAVIPLTLILAIKKFENFFWLDRLRSPLRVWFKKGYEWWFAVELGRRLVLILMVVALPGNRYAVFFVFCISMGLFLYVQPYSMPVANWLDFSFSITSFLLYLLFLPEKPVAFDRSSYTTGSDGCSDEVNKFSVFSILGGILYMSPLVVSIIVLSVWVSIKVFRHVKTIPRKQIFKLSSFRNKRTTSEAAVEIQSKFTTYLSRTADGHWIHEAQQPTNETSTEIDQMDHSDLPPPPPPPHRPPSGEYPDEKTTEIV